MNFLIRLDRDTAQINVGPAGLEPVDVTSLNDNELRESTFQSGTESGTGGDDSVTFGPDLQFIVDRWNELSEIAKLEIKTLIRNDDGIR